MKRKLMFIAAALALTAILIPAVASAAGVTATVTAMGQGAIVNSDRAMAREKAIDDAMRRAVEQAVGTMVSSETLTNNFQLVSDNIYSNSKGYIQKYEVVSEKVEDEPYPVVSVTIKADVCTGVIEEKLAAIGILISRKGKPRVMFLFSEQNIGQETAAGVLSSDTGIVENTLIDVFQRNGFTVIDRQALSGQISVDDAMSAISGNTQKARKIANLAHAQVIIYGTAIATDAGKMSDKGLSMHSCQSVISARSLNADSGEILATESVHKAFPHIDPMTGGSQAMKLAADEIGNKLIEKIMAKWTQELSAGQMVAVEISGVPNITIVTEFKTMLTTQIRNVQRVDIKKLAKENSALDIEYRGNAQSLASDLEGKKIGNKYSLEVLEATPNTMKIKIVTEVKSR